MLPEVEVKDFRKGAQWFSMKRQHAVIVMADYLYYSKFRAYCQPGFEGRNCIGDEHYLPTFFQIVPGGIANWSVTHATKELFLNMHKYGQVPNLVLLYWMDCVNANFFLRHYRCLRL